MMHYVNNRKVVTLFYDSKINRFTDGYGDVIHDIFRYITPNQLMLFRESGNACIVYSTDNTFKVSLIPLNDIPF